MPPRQVPQRITRLRAMLAPHADADRAAQQQRYMKSAMPFLGVAMGQVRRIAAAEVRAEPCRDRADMLAFARALWDGARVREERYLALAICRDRRHLAFQDRACMPTYRHFITSGAWWDLVDETSRIVGDVLDADTAATRVVRRWATDGDMWIRRAAMICQRHRGERTDTDLLRATLEPNLSDSEFFIRKAAGWALRQFARTDPDWVRRFIAEHEMSGLTRREALRHIDTA